jgi:hypothetical protein
MRFATFSAKKLVFAALACGVFYGAAMGSYGGVAGGRGWQLVYSASKVPLLLCLTFLLSLPSFYVLNSLLGLRGHFAHVVRGLAEAQAGLTIVLASLAPYTLFSYASGIAYTDALLFNGLMFGTASAAGQVLLRRRLRARIAAVPRLRWAVRLWFVIYGFVGIQMGWVLRPFVGSPFGPPRFLREEAWGNAYLVLWKLVLRFV